MSETFQVSLRKLPSCFLVNERAAFLRPSLHDRLDYTPSYHDRGLAPIFGQKSMRVLQVVFLGFG